MSDDKKRDRAMQRLVRERQAKTGESYQAAWQQLADQTEPLVPKQSSPDSGSSSVHRVLLPFSTTVKVLPGESAQITTRPQLVSFWPDRLLIKNTERWDIHRLTIGVGKSPWSSLLEDGPRPCPASMFSLNNWHPLVSREVTLGECLTLVVTYTGPNEQGEIFEACLFGWDACPPAKESARNNPGDTGKRVSERAESKSVRVNEMAVLPVTIASPALFVDRFTIANAADWIVHDIRTHGKSIFVQSGDLPGELFSGSAPVVLEPLAAKDRVEIAATYIGNTTASCLMIELSGTTEPPSTQRAASYFLPLSTDVPIVPAQSAQITGACGKDFLPERLLIADPDAWIINDLRVGNRCLTAQSGNLPAQAFSSRAVGCGVTFDSVYKGMAFVIVTTRAESCEEAGFYAGIQGRLIPRR
jgi:hypothetical protein